MYDPLIVDVFARVYKDIAPTETQGECSATGLSSITRGTLPNSETSLGTTSRLDDISASTEEMLLLYELAQGLSGETDLADAADLISKHLRRLVPATTCVFFVYDADADELIAAHAAGENAAHFTSIRIATGQRLSGWVAANRQTILNSDPILDLGEVARVLRPPLRSCLSTPLSVGGELVCVLTVYSTHRVAFTEDHQRIIEVIARQVSQTVQRALGFRKEQSETLCDQHTGLPSRQHFDRFVTSELSSGEGLPCSILLIDISKQALARSNERGPLSHLLSQVSPAMRSGLRGADLLFTYDDNRLVALLTQTDAITAEAVGKRVASRLGHISATDESGNVSNARVGRATAPDDGTMLPQLIRSAESRLVSVTKFGRPSVH
jgi:GGDEF domain-containing protein